MKSFFTLLVKKKDIEKREKVTTHTTSLESIQSKLFMLCLIFFFKIEILLFKLQPGSENTSVRRFATN
jgi:hypothetical protein